MTYILTHGSAIVQVILTRQQFLHEMLNTKDYCLKEFYCGTDYYSNHRPFAHDTHVDSEDVTNVLGSNSKERVTSPPERRNLPQRIAWYKCTQ